MTILEIRTLPATEIWTERLTGPRGSRNWTKTLLSDGRVSFVGPDCHGNIPRWILQHVPAGQKITRAGGSTYAWSGWITEVTNGEYSPTDRR